MNKFKVVLTSIISIIIVAFLISSIIFISDYLDKTKKYNEYKTKVEKTTDDNDSLIENNKALLALNSQYEKDKADLQKKIDTKKIQIVEKEKIVYKDSQLIIPPDYNDLKTNYVVLSGLYYDRGILIDDLEKKNTNNNKQIIDLSNALEKTNSELEKTNNLLKNPVEKPTTFISQGVLFGVGVNIDNTLSYSAGYLVTIKDKIYLEGLLSYPPQAKILIGFKL